MTHHHDNHSHDISSALSFDRKMIKLLEHWIKHNCEHVATYRDWAEKAKDNAMYDVSIRLEEAAVISEELNKKLEETLKTIKP